MSRGRPPTSKSRGICKYYTTEHGCFAGSKCKFLHGEHERLTPYDKSKTCRFYAAGFCKRGDDCWFLHIDGERDKASGSRVPKPGVGSAPDTCVEEEEEVACSICMETPTNFGLLSDCSHVFCLNCIKEWRKREDKSEDIVASGATKKCPMCRTSSKYVIPSSVFYAQDHPRKALVLEQYKASMARVPCRYFEASSESNRFCPFGNDCFYRHHNQDGTAYTFDHGADHYMRQRRRHPRADDFSSVESPLLHDLRAALAAFRASLAELPSAPRRVNEVDSAQDESTEDVDDFERAARLLQDDMLEQFMEIVANLGILTVGEEAQQPHTDGVASSVVRLFDTDNDAEPAPTPESGSAASQTALNELYEVLPRPDFATLAAPFTVGTENTDAADQTVLDYGTESGDGSLPPPRDEALLDQAILDTDDSPTTPHQEVQPSDEGHPPTPLSSFAESRQDEPLPVVVHDSDPPFMTDGRGRVIWSSNTRRGGRTTSEATPARPPLQRNKSHSDCCLEGEASNATRGIEGIVPRTSEYTWKTMAIVACTAAALVLLYTL